METTGNQSQVFQGGAGIVPTKCRQKSPLAWQNIGDYLRALSLANRTKKAGELLGRSGLQLPRVPSLNTDRADSTEAAICGYRLGYQRQQEGADSC